MSSSNTWAWADHACRNCHARLICRDDGAGPPVFECGTCTINARGTPDGICGCGTLPKPAKPDPKAPRFRCIANPNRTVTEFAAVVIQWGVGS